MPEDGSPEYPDPRKEDIMAGDRRISRPDASLPDWEVPDTAYRPIPIVWFTAAMMVQLMMLTAIFFAFIKASGALTIAAAGLTTGIVGAWTWSRGMKAAPRNCKTATIVMLCIQLGFVVLVAGSRL